MAETQPPRIDKTTVGLAGAQILSWGSLFYAFALVAPGLEDEGWSTSAVTGAFSVGLLVSGLVAPQVARALSDVGPRATMVAGSLIGGLGMIAWAVAPSLPLLYAAWVLIGVGMAGTFYEAAISALVLLRGPGARRSIIVVTVVGGLASTIASPIIGMLVSAHGWRIAVAVVGVTTSLVTAAIHLLVLPADSPAQRGAQPASARSQQVRPILNRLRLAVLLEHLGHIVSTTFLVGLLVVRGLSMAEAAMSLAVIGIGKVAGRLLLAGPAGSAPPAVAASLAAITQAALMLVPLSTSRLAVILASAGLLGAAAGVLTVLRPLITMDLVDRAEFPAVTARLQRAGLVGRVSGPLAFGVAADQLGWELAWVVAACVFVGAAVAYVQVATGMRPASRLDEEVHRERVPGHGMPS